jgi:hypothetical protein
VIVTLELTPSTGRRRGDSIEIFILRFCFKNSSASLAGWLSSLRSSGENTINLLIVGYSQAIFFNDALNGAGQQKHNHRSRGVNAGQKIKTPMFGRTIEVTLLFSEYLVIKIG